MRRIHDQAPASESAPERFGVRAVRRRVHTRDIQPHERLVLQALWSCALVATGTYRALFTHVIYTEWILFALMSVGLMRLRKRVMFVPLVFAAAALLVAAIQIQADAAQAAVGLLLVVAGLPVYWWKRKRFG